MCFRGEVQSIKYMTLINVTMFLLRWHLVHYNCDNTELIETIMHKSFYVLSMMLLKKLEKLQHNAIKKFGDIKTHAPCVPKSYCISICMNASEAKNIHLKISKVEQA